jgi:hypothetical protein
METIENTIAHVCYRGSITSYPPVFCANLEEMSLAFLLLSVVFPLMFDHRLQPVDPALEHTEPHFLVDSR